MLKSQIFTIILCFLISCNIVTAHAVSGGRSNDYCLDVDVNEIQKFSLSCIGANGYPLVKNDAYLRRHYSYSTDAKNELCCIAFILNNLSFIDDEKQYIDADSSVIDVDLTDSNGDVRNFQVVMSRLHMNGKQYGMDTDCKTEFGRFLDFVYALKTGKVVLENEITFEPSDWAKEDVNKAIGTDLLPKWNQIAYTSDISRVEVCQLIDNLLTVKSVDKKESSKDCSFDDTSDISVKELYSQGIVAGRTDTEFCPWDNITREEFAKILVNTCNVISVDDESDNVNLTYSDEKSIADWASESVKTVTALGLMQGNENGCFNPQDNITKEQVISTLLRLYKCQTTT